jgi:hypothetical protein
MGMLSFWNPVTKEFDTNAFAESFNYKKEP